MQTFDIQEAAAFLKIHPVTLYRMAARGEIPAARPGKKWVFLDVDLADWLRAKYRSQASSSDSRERSKKCHSTDVRIHPIGGSRLLIQKDDEYSKALGLPIE
jgi:excisionase family DNA binding protein